MNMPSVRLRLAALLLAALAGMAGAQPAPPAASALEPQFATVPVPRDVVGSLAQDRQGLIWIGTSDGLARFDGYRLRPIEREGDTPVQRNLGWVRSLAAAADGGMWIGTEVNGLARYDPAFDRVSVLGSGGERATPIRALAEDGAGLVWVGTLGQGLLRYDPKAGRFSTEPLLVDGTPERRVLALAVGRDGALWAGHWRGLARRDARGAWAALPLPLPGEAVGISTLLEDRSGRIWFGSVDGRVGFIDSNGNGARPRWLPPRFKGSVQALAQGADGTIWAGLTDGIAWLDGENGTLLRQLRHNPHLPGALAGNDINVLLRDQTGAMWVGGYGVGLQRHQQHPALAVRGPDASGPLASSDLRGLLPRRDGLLMVASHSGPVALLDRALHTVGRWPREADTPVDALAEGPDGSVWLVADGRLERREPRSARLLASWALEGGRAHRVLALPSGEVWVGMQDGLWRLPSPQARIERVRRADGEPLRGGVHALRVEPGSRRLWVGALAGLFRWDGQHLAEVQGAPGEALGFPAVLGLLSTRDGSLYVDTAVSGLHRLKGYDAQGRARFERISERLGAPGRPFGVNLHEDGLGRVWSQQSVYDPAADRLDELSGSEGPPMGTPRFFADAELPDGRLLFCGSRGLLVVEPLAFMPSRYAPPVVVSSLRRNGRPFHPGQDLRRGLTLPAGTRSFAVEFAALDYIDPAKLRYQTRLVGWDQDWTSTDASARFASYGGLPPGRYRLEVRATNHHGLWSDRPLQLDVELLPAWWQTRWAQAAAALSLLAGAWALLRWSVARRTAQLRRREAELRALVEQRTAELREASTTDPLTGLRNRRYLDSRIASDLQLCLRHYKEPRPRHPDDEADLLVMLMDIDHFKRINDMHGHTAGDQVLAEFARRLRAVFRESDVLVRWGGEEFLALARGGARSGATELAERFRSAVRDRLFPLADGPNLAVTVSIGFAVFPLDPGRPQAWDWDATLRLADAALYAAKARGRDGYVGALSANGLRPEELDLGSAAWMDDARLQVRHSG